MIHNVMETRALQRFHSEHFRFLLRETSRRESGFGSSTIELWISILNRLFRGGRNDVVRLGRPAEDRRPPLRRGGGLPAIRFRISKRKSSDRSKVKNGKIGRHDETSKNVGLGRGSTDEIYMEDGI
ncbi:hypothetical protein SDJN03_26216, partial [Cucurbita argyrosperma subsp. sororia]